MLTIIQRIFSFVLQMNTCGGSKILEIPEAQTKKNSETNNTIKDWYKK